MAEVFLALLSKITPLYLLIGCGYISARYLEVQGKNIANTMFYFFVPITIFHGVWIAKLTPAMLLLPLLTFSISTALCFLFLWFSRKLYKGAEANILALSAGLANCGYFGLPVALLLFPPETVGIYITSFLGMTLFQNSFGMYVAARGRYHARDAFRKTITLPTLYAFLLAVILNFTHVPAPELMENFFRDVRGAYTVLGMMMIGIGIGAMQKFVINWRFLSVAFAARFLAYPVMIGLMIALDYYVLHWFGWPVYHSLMLLGLVPLAADTVAIATMMECHADAMSGTVLVSTLFALLYIPFMAAILF